jgi:hypothetical protein
LNPTPFQQTEGAKIMNPKEKRRPLTRILSVVMLFGLLAGPWTMPCPAVVATSAAIPAVSPTNTTDTDYVYDFEVAHWIDQYFNDGVANNRVCNSNIIMYYTQCYGGDWLGHFNATTGETTHSMYSDAMSYTNAAVYSANGPGGKSVAGGYDDECAAAVHPANQSEYAHLQGFAGARSVEVPCAQGTSRLLSDGGRGKTYVLLYSGYPSTIDSWDQDMLINIVDNYRSNSLANTTITVLANDGTPLRDDIPTQVASRANLRTALQTIGAAMTTNPDDTFVFFVSDHGSEVSWERKLKIASAFTLYSPASFCVTHDQFEAIDQNSTASFLATIESTTSFDPHDVALYLGEDKNAPCITLSDATQVQTGEREDDQGVLHQYYSVRIPASYLSAFDPLDQGPYELKFGLRNGTNQELLVSTGINTGPVARLAVPEPGVFTLLLTAVSILILFAFRKRGHSTFRLVGGEKSR